jgi:DNA repair protein RadD
MTELRPYQEEALQAIRETVGQGVRRLVVQAPTGSGKTLLAAALVEGALRKGNRLAFVVPAISLVDQTVEMFYAEGIKEVGVIQADHQLTNWARPVQVCSIQTIRSRKAYPEAAVVVFDEVHQLHAAHIKWMGRLSTKKEKAEGAGAVVEAAEGWENVPFIGLSATPWTSGLGRYFSSLLVMSTTYELIKQGYLSSFKVYAADHPNLKGVKTVAGDYHEGQLAKVMGRDALIANVVDTWRTRWGKDKTLLFAVNCDHAKVLQARFREAGINCGYQDAHTPSTERLALKRAFHAGEVQIIANVGTMTTGVDYDVRCLILARPTKSEMLYVQIIGRCLRTAEGKQYALILDHTDTTARLGFVTEIHHEHLSQGRMDESSKKLERKPPLPRLCSQCDFLMPAGAKKCPECGYERPITTRIFEYDGELQEYDPMSGDPSPTHAARKFYEYSYAEKMRFFLQLKAHGEAKGYKPGWAKVTYREKFKDWPAWNWNDLPSIPTGVEVANYIRSRWIAKAKASAAVEAAYDEAWREHDRRPQG